MNGFLLVCRKLLGIQNKAGCAAIILEVTKSTFISSVILRG
jgi:hypothetical protein